MKKYIPSQLTWLLLSVSSITASVYLAMILLHASIPFNTHFKAHVASSNYLNIHSFNLLTRLAPHDAQWYITIAAHGYPDHPNSASGQVFLENAPRYAFFPLYPMLLMPFGPNLMNITIAAFIYAQIFVILGVVSMYYVLTRIDSSKTAIATILLLYTFPFSVFYHTYFTEGIFLLQVVWYGYFWMRKNYIVASVFLGLMCVTRGNAIPLVLFLWIDILYIHRHTLDLRSKILVIVISILPLCVWIMYNYLHTADALYFLHVQSLWSRQSDMLAKLIHNLGSIYRSISVSPTSTQDNPMNSLMLILTAALLRHSYKKIPMKLWIMSAVFAVTPLLTTNIISYGRYQIVSYPLFMYAATQLKPSAYVATIAVFTLLLFICSVCFVNWYWLG